MHNLDFLASAIAGRSVTVQEIENNSLTDNTYTDGTSIFVDKALTGQQQRDAVLFQALLLGCNSLHKQIARALIGRPGVARQFLVLEIYRCLQLNAGQLPSSLLSRYAHPARIPITSSAEASLKLAGNRSLKLEVRPEFGVIRPMALRNLESPAKGGALSQRELEGKLNIGFVDEHDEDEETGTSKLLDMLKNPLSSGNNALSRALNDILGGGSQKGKGEDDDEGYGSVPMDRAVQTVLSNQGTRQQLPRDAAPVPTVLQESQAPFKYPEWNDNTQSYTSDHCHVMEYEPWEEPQNLKHLGLDHSHQLTHQMTRVGVEYQFLKQQPTGEDFDLDALINHSIDLTTGHSPDESIYRLSKKTRRDLSTLMLLDISGSTKDINEVGISIHQQQAVFVEALAKALSRLGDQVALYGFHSWGNRLVRFMRVKSFGERYGRKIERRLEQLRPSGYSRLGAAIRHATYLVERQRLTHHRLLLFVTDGFAYDDGYEDRYAEADTVKALEEARNKGIACACISIGSDKTDRGLVKTFGETAYLRCDKIAELPKKLRKHLQGAIASAAG